MDQNRQSQYVMAPAGMQPGMQPMYQTAAPGGGGMAQQQQYQRPTVPFSRPWHITKLVFLSLSLTFSIIAIGITAALITGTSSSSSSVYYRSYQFVWVVPQAGVAAIWAVAEFITVCARGGQRGIHPGAHVGMHLVLWLGFGAAVGLEAFTVYYDYYYCGSYCRRYASGLVNSTQAALAFCVLLTLIHFFLFVRACVETQQRNSMATHVYMVPAQPMYYQQQPGQPMMMAAAPYGVSQAASGPPSEMHKYPSPLPQAHTAGFYGPQQEQQQQQQVNKHVTGSTVGPPASHSSSGVPEDGLHPAGQYQQQQQYPTFQQQQKPQ